MPLGCPVQPYPLTNAQQGQMPFSPIPTLRRNPTITPHHQAAN